MRRFIATLVVGGMLVFGLAPAAGAGGQADAHRNACSNFGVDLANNLAMSGEYGSIIKGLIESEQFVPPAHGGCPDLSGS